MSALLVQDYLQTQGLQLPQDEVLVALRLAQAVISMGGLRLNAVFYGMPMTRRCWPNILKRMRAARLC